MHLRQLLLASSGFAPPWVAGAARRATLTLAQGLASVIPPEVPMRARLPCSPLQPPLPACWLASRRDAHAVASA